MAGTRMSTGFRCKAEAPAAGWHVSERRPLATVPVRQRRFRRHGRAPDEVLLVRVPLAAVGSAMASRDPTAQPPPDSPSRLSRWEWAATGTLMAATLLVHDVGYLLSRPFWNDEAWVAVTTRYPLGALPATTSSTPIGWSFLLRLMIFGGQQRLRLLPLLFAALCIPAAYCLVRRLPWPDTASAKAPQCWLRCASSALRP
jgi:hypothetical protein